MHHIIAAEIVVPIVAALAIAFWIFMVFRADAHPLYKHQYNRPPGEVSGGSFTAEDGGRQLMPRPDGRASTQVPAARSAKEHGEQYEPQAAHGSYAGERAGEAAQTGSNPPRSARPLSALSHDQRKKRARTARLCFR